VLFAVIFLMLLASTLVALLATARGYFVRRTERQETQTAESWHRGSLYLPTKR